MTRLTRMASGMYTVEKRCILPDEHRRQYPGNDVVIDGCGMAWDNYVQYCTCSKNYCNEGNISRQQERAGMHQPVQIM